MNTNLDVKVLKDGQGHSEQNPGFDEDSPHSSLDLDDSIVVEVKDEIIEEDYANIPSDEELLDDLATEIEITPDLESVSFSNHFNHGEESQWNPIPEHSRNRESRSY